RADRHAARRGRDLPAADVPVRGARLAELHVGRLWGAASRRTRVRGAGDEKAAVRRSDVSADTAETPGGRETAGGRPLLRTLRRAQERLPLAQLAAIVALFIYGASTIDGFSSSGSVKSML